MCVCVCVHQCVYPQLVLATRLGGGGGHLARVEISDCFPTHPNKRRKNHRQLFCSYCMGLITVAYTLMDVLG